MAYAITVPDTLEMLLGEQFRLMVDFSNVLGGIVVDRPLVLVNNESVDEQVLGAIIDTPYFSGNILHFTLSSAALRSGSTYVVTLLGFKDADLGVIVGEPIVAGSFSSLDHSGVGGVAMVLTVKIVQ